MKKKITDNWEMKILAVLFAIVIWLVVVNIDDPVKSVEFSGIEVEILNASALTEQNKVYEVLDDTNYVTVTVKGRRTIIEDLGKENIRAVADMNDLTDMDTLSIKLSTNKYANDIDDIKCSTDNVKLNIEDSKRVQKVIEIVTVGEPAENYMLGEITTNLNQVYLEGPESSIDTVDAVRASLDVDGISSSISSSIPLTLYDANGALIEDSRITKNINTVSVSQQVLAVKEVPVRYEVTGTPAEGYALTGNIKHEINSVLIAGAKSNIDSVNAIVVSGDKFDVTNRKNDLIVRIDLADYLPSKVIFANSDFKSMVNVAVEINRETFSTAVIEEKDIRVTNIPTGMTAKVNVDAKLISDGKINLRLLGLSEKLQDVDIDNLTASIDLQAYMQEQGLGELSEGDYQISPDFGLPDGVRVSPELLVTVHVTKK